MFRRTSCRFHQQPGGCRKGESCEFLHAGPSGGSPHSSMREASASPFTTPERRRAPNGFCNEFWTTGQCKRNFDCRFKHERQISLITQSRVVPATQSMPITRVLNATEVHNHLGRFLRDNYRFTSPNDIYAFISLLGHATKENNWV
jgi:hypothetical protein